MATAKSTTAGASAASAGSPASFLQNAPRKYYAIQGTVPTGSGGAATQVTWQQPPPIIPAYCTKISINIQQVIKLVFAANGDHAYISPYAPYSGWNNQITLGGAPPWAATELTPWYLDDIACRIDYDLAYPGLGGANSGFPATNFLANVLDLGQAGWITTIGSAAPAISLTAASTSDNINPGAYIANTSGGTNAVLLLTANFTVEMRLQRKRHLLWGAIPMGDPENRPNNLMQLLPIVGTNPEQCIVVSPPANSAAIVGTLNAQATVTCVYELAYIDLLPGNVQVPEPTVGFGLQLTAATVTGLAAGTYGTITHRTAQAYTAIHHILVNGGTGATPAYAKPIQGSYFGLWDDQDPQSARWQFDTTQNTFQEYFAKYERDKRRPPLIGQYLADFENGVLPEIPSVDPYDAIMSPDATYAAAFGVPVTPAMTTVVRVPTGVTAVNAYVRYYAFGLVKVPY
jgi:hypothetical protein